MKPGPMTDRIVRLPGAHVEPSFPHVLAPMAGESLFGFTVRTDHANSLPVGTTVKMVARYTRGWRTLSQAYWASGSIFDLVRLARLTGNDLSAIQELTLMPALRRLFGNQDVPIESLGRFHGTPTFCTDCWHEERLVRRTFLLPGIEACVWHDRRLVPFPLGASRLAGLAAAALAPEVLARQRDLYRVWALVLDTGTPEVLGAGYRVIARLGRDPSPAVSVIARRIQSGRHSAQTIVHALVALQIDPELLAELLADEAAPRPCPNQACPRFAPAPEVADPVRPVERHCPICGSRFIGQRILLTFDPAHGHRSPSPRSVAKAVRRLRRWKVALRVACADLVAEGIEPTVGVAFPRARVPMNANLRAERLGLVAIVRDAARRHRLMHSSQQEPFSQIDMQAYRRLMEIVIDRDWVGIAEWGQEHGVMATIPDHCRSWMDNPKTGVLEPLFNGAWARRRRPEDVMAVWRMATERSDRLLSEAWLRRRLRGRNAGPANR